MAGSTCKDCGGKARKNHNLCMTCEKKSNEDHQGRKNIVNEILMYADFHRESSTSDSIVAALAGTWMLSLWRKLSMCCMQRWESLDSFMSIKTVNSFNKKDGII